MRVEVCFMTGLIARLKTGPRLLIDVRGARDVYEVTR